MHAPHAALTKSDEKRPVRVRRQANPHRPGISPALGLRAGDDGLALVSQTAR
jgi:hypothetical protein